MIDSILGKVICGDALEIMRGMPDKCVDLVLTDPPYGIGETHRKNNSRGRPSIIWPKGKATNYGEYYWDNERLNKKYLDEFRRVSKNQVIWGGIYYSDFLPYSPCWLVWHKLINGDFADCEIAWTSFRSAVRLFLWRWNGFMQQDMKNKEVRVHPTQKPVKLGIWILKNYSKPTDIIFDPMCGSGSFLIAAAQLGQRWIGCDISPDYCRMAEERIKRETAQQNMFHKTLDNAAP